ncbi:MAG: hypothetical protein ACLQM8_02485 [Limisphaerales bacterium]
MTFKEFIALVSNQAGLTLPRGWAALDEIPLARQFLSAANRYFYQTYLGIGATRFEGAEFRYFSDFHRFWEQNHQRILNARIERPQAAIAARALRDAIQAHGNEILRVNRNLHGLTPQQLAQVRFFTANQDFRQPPDDQFTIYLEHPEVFNPAAVEEDPDDFLTSMGLNRLSQSDKRRDFARNAARFLNENGITAFQIAEHFENSAPRIRRAIIAFGNTGYGEKKSNMLIRDMYVWNVWPALEDFDQVDVASDINTMKVALRTRIVRTDIPLLSSFLDIFCHQYSYIDRMSAEAWRAVWEEWRMMGDATAPPSPCLLDFLIYRLGREYCKPMAGHYVCQEGGHDYYQYGPRLQERKCATCAAVRPRVNRVGRLAQYVLPCEVPQQKLPRNPDGALLLDADNLLYTFDGHCPFAPACRPDAEDFRVLMPPRSISIKGQTGWTDAYSDVRQGGGGLSS